MNGTGYVKIGDIIINATLFARIDRNKKYRWKIKRAVFSHKTTDRLGGNEQRAEKSGNVKAPLFSKAKDRILRPERPLDEKLFLFVPA